ncbi:hypothetical protein [Afifella sp. H1R]|uniref:hypothetical protein n=1 Tax=unclassified Afifella TaxID=2624128 RepID=UPI001F48A93F|nr:hypothetical protein [Afifella sp. H1R]MCF1503788.1 hypothetical protein [Afifella sp. H1R]
MAMRIDQELADFIASPVMMIVGTRDRANRAEIGRGVGAWSVPDASAVEIVVSAWQWGATVANLRDTGAAAITFTRPVDYVSYQVKGRALVGEAPPAARDRSARYIAAMTEALAALGVTPAMSSLWLSGREPVLVRLAIEAVFHQTPGPRAGKEVEAER